MRLKSVQYVSCKMEYRIRRATEPEWVLDKYLVNSQKWLLKAESDFAQVYLEEMQLNQDFESLRWFIVFFSLVTSKCG